MDIGESLVGSYMRQVRGCQSVAFNTFIGKQAEIDVIGVRNSDAGVEVWVAEVAVHLEGLNYGGYPTTATKIRTKIDAARHYASDVYKGATITYEFWSPVVPSGLVAMIEDVDIHLVANADFTARVNELAHRAKAHTAHTGDDAYRFLQLLTHLRGARPRFGPPETP